MSQIQDFNAGGIPLPNIQTLTGDVGGAVSPDGLFNIDILGGNGVVTTGNPAANSITIDIGTVTGTGTTIGAGTTDAITYPLGATAGSYSMIAMINGYSPATGDAYMSQTSFSIKTNGAAGILTGGFGYWGYHNVRDAAVAACNFIPVIVGNNLIIRITGTAGFTMNWIAILSSITFIS